MASYETLIAAKTAAETQEFEVPQGFIASLCVNDMGVGEAIAVEIYTLNGWQQYYAQGTAIELSADTNKIGFDIPGRYRLNKPVTVAAVGVLRELS
jgi:hypothetical protein